MSIISHFLKKRNKGKKEKKKVKDSRKKKEKKKGLFPSFLPSFGNNNEGGKEKQKEYFLKFIFLVSPPSPTLIITDLKLYISCSHHVIQFRI